MGTTSIAGKSLLATLPALANAARDTDGALRSIYCSRVQLYDGSMLVGKMRGWAEAVARAREIWPEIPAWAYEIAAETEAPANTYGEAEWFSVHPATAAEQAVRAACAKGWRFTRRHL
jgi:hypothetical protein